MDKKPDDKIKSELVICPECGAKFEIGEYQEFEICSKEAFKANKEIMSVRSWTKFNNIIIGLLGFVVLALFLLIDVSTMSKAYYFLWILNSAIRICGVILLAKIEIKAFRKLMRKKYPLAFY